MKRRKMNYNNFSKKLVSEAESYFNRKFKFKNNENWSLPKNVYESQEWINSDLQIMKNELNYVKGQLSKFEKDEWANHTKFRDPSSSVIKTLKTKFNPELLTQAWCKFYECICHHEADLLQYLTTSKHFYSLHLCEAPGAFICALNHFIVSQLDDHNIEWTWLATSLNPNYEGNSVSEMIPDDRLLCYTNSNWNFGIDGTGDITKYYNHLSIVQEATKKGKVWLVTADGSVDCSAEPGEQETHVHFLHYCETITALSVLETGGMYILKLFTMFEHSTVCLMYLLNCTFNTVHVFKPCTSKSGNSEVYVICVRFKGLEVLSNVWPALKSAYQDQSSKVNFSMFALDDINEDFLNQLRLCSKYFMQKQMCTINQNIKYFEKKCIQESIRIKKMKANAVKHFIKHYRISWIPQNRNLIPDCNIVLSPFDFGFHFSYYYRLFYLNTIWSYKQNFKTFKTDEFILHHANTNHGIFDVKIGKAVDQLHHSKFCAENFSLRINNNTLKTHPILYSIVSDHLSQFNIIINILDFQNKEVNYLFQKEVFYILKEKIERCNKNIILIGIPFVTNFLSNMLYILMLGFHSVTFLNNGIVLLHNPHEENMRIVKRYFNVIDAIYWSLDNYKHPYFKTDILQIISPELLHVHNFVDIVWNYNNSFLKCVE